jgi:hypothetical protein
MVALAWAGSRVRVTPLFASSSRSLRLRAPGGVPTVVWLCRYTTDSSGGSWACPRNWKPQPPNNNIHKPKLLSTIRRMFASLSTPG